MRLIFIFVVLFCAALSGCEKDPQGLKRPVTLDLPMKSSEIIQASNRFGVDLFRETSLVEDKNLMLSPLSASTALTMLLNGCKDNTYDQIRDMLGYQDLSLGQINATYQSLVQQLLSVDPEIDLALANAVWYRNTFQVHASYLDTMDQAFKARIEALDFTSPSALQMINGWASDNTHGKIEKVLDEINAETVMFLMNALYFKGTWTVRFDEDQTAPATFTKDDGTAVQVETMRGEVPIRLYSASDYLAVELTYGQQNFSMVIIEPLHALNDFMASFNHEIWEDLTENLDAISDPVETNLSLPRFTFDYEKILNDQLMSLGMQDAFMPYQADLSGISDQQIFVSFVKQNTFVEVNEEGTEAAAVTTIGIDLTSVGPEPVFIDKPFIFAIRERTSNTLLFIGKVILPDY